jgi:uncharacterized LabA/DUF88 family protein
MLVEGKKIGPGGPIPAASLGFEYRRPYTTIERGANMSSVATYVDGFNLYFGMRSCYCRKHLWLDVVEMTRYLRPKDQVVKVRYFTAIVKGEPTAAENQFDYMEAMRAHNGPLLDVHVGRFKERPIRQCRRCGQSYTCDCGRPYRTLEEKGTDVALGAMMVADAARGLADTTVLVSADTDLAPALAAVRLVAPEQRIFIALPPGNKAPSRHLMSPGNLGHFFIKEAALRDAQLPDVVHDAATGRTLVRPAKWR